MPDPLIEEAYAEAVALLKRSATPHGFLASPTEHANYRRIWARDGIVCGVAGLTTGDAELADTLRATLETLATEQGPQGQIPSNVLIGPDGTPEEVSYGGLAGRVDPIPWFVLGVARYVAATGDDAFGRRMAPAVEEALALLDAWEFNNRGLVYVPQSGNWADEYDLHGYLLYDQVLRLGALEAWSPHADRPLDLERLERLVRVNFWPEADLDDADRALIYHVHAHRRYVERGEALEHPVAGFSPGGYANRFDAWGSAIALALGVAFHDPHTRRLLDYGEGLRDRMATRMLPAFWPPVTETTPAWAGLAENYRETFTNRPGHYHNGGCWPVANGWWGMALLRNGRRDAAEELLGAMARFCRLDEGDGEWGFFEYAPADAERPAGVRHLAWSAAGIAMLHQALTEFDRPHPPARLAPADDYPPFDAVVAGELLVDFISTENADRLDTAEHFERFAGGSAANLAGNLARLGGRVVFVGAVGDDGFGRFLTSELACAGLELRVASRSERPTTHIMITRGSGTADFAAHRGADRLLRPDQLPNTLLANARLFHTTGFAMAREPARSVLLDAARRAVAQGTAVSVDLNVAPQTERARRRDQDALRTLCRLGALVKCSLDDLTRLFGDAEDVERRITMLHDWGSPLVAYTRGAEGTLLSWDGGHATAEVPSIPVEVKDATGAGDAFWGGFLTAWLAGHGPPTCAAAGSRLAALKLQRVGPLPPHVPLDVLYTEPEEA